MDDSTILLATSNRAKQAKLHWLLDGLGLSTATPADLGTHFEPSETGATHGDIAGEKALGWSRQVSCVVISSDGGAHIPALSDAWTSVRTRRAAGPDATDRDRAEHLLALMRDRTEAERDVVWREAVAIARGGRLLGCWEAEGRLGRLAETVDPVKIAGGFWMAGLIVVPRFEKLYRDLTADELAQVDDAWNGLRQYVRTFFGASAG